LLTRSLVNYAAVMGLIEDTDLPDNGFSHLAIAFYCSFLIFEPVQAYCIQRFPVAKWLGANGQLMLCERPEQDTNTCNSDLLGYRAHDELCLP
jgi:hypothetical protein